MSEQKPIALLAPPKEKVWRAKPKKGEKAKEIPFSQLENEHLQKAYYFSQSKELEHFNKAIVFQDLRESLEEEAKRRGMELHSIEEHKHIGNYFKNNREFKERQ